jgi:hypothetical protein
MLYNKITRLEKKIYHLLKLIFPVPSSIVKGTSVSLSTLLVTNPKTLTFTKSTQQFKQQYDMQLASDN